MKKITGLIQEVKNLDVRFSGYESPKRIPVVMAKGSHLFPYRTQKLSLSAPMVLGWRRPGRVGHCRIPYEKSFRRSLGLFSYPIDINLLSGYLGQRATLYLDSAKPGAPSGRCSPAERPGRVGHCRIPNKKDTQSGVFFICSQQQPTLLVPFTAKCNIVLG